MPTNIKEMYETEGGKAGTSVRSDRPAHGNILIPYYDPSRQRGVVAKSNDLFSDSEVFVNSLVIAQAFTMVPGTAIYDQDDNLVTADIVWADGRDGTLEREMLDVNGSYQETYTRFAPAGGHTTHTLRKIYDASGRESGSLISSGGSEPGLKPKVVVTAHNILPFVRADYDEGYNGNTYEQSYVVRAYNRGTEPVQIVAPLGWEISLDGAPYARTAEFSHDNSQVIAVRCLTSAVGAVTGTISHILGTAYESLKVEAYVGDGSQEYPYPVATPGQLSAVRDTLSAHHKQIADIDLSGVDWLPIGFSNPFTGVYDGNGKAITNLECDQQENAGLFGRVSGATIKNLSIKGTVTGVYAGLLAGQVGGGIIQDVDVGGQVEAAGFGGGLIGLSADSVTIERCSAAGGVDATGKAEAIGGLMGVGLDAILTDCYADVALDGECHVVGGLVGHADSAPWTGGTYENCYAVGAVTATAETQAGGLVGQDEHQTLTVNSCYWDTETTGQPTSDGGAGKTTVEMKQQATFVNWNFVDIWSIDEGNDYPKLIRI